MPISPLNNTAMTSNNSIERQNKDTLTKAQRDAGFSNDNYIHTSDKKAKEKLESAKGEAGSMINPYSKLDKDAFMKLLLEELKHQDPTSPMDSDKMLTQTSQLAALETQEKTNKTMNMLAERMETLGNSLGIGMLGAVGKLATMNKEGFKHDGKDVSLQFNLYFPNKVSKDVKIGVYNENYEQVDAFVIESKDITKGNNNFLWDTRYADGTIREKGEFKFLAEYEDEQGNIVRIPSGYFKIDGVKFENGKAYFMAGEKMKISLDDIKEIKDELI